MGGDLAALLRADGRLPETAVLRLGRDLSAGLQALHAAGLVHNDLRPASILLDGGHGGGVGRQGCCHSRWSHCCCSLEKAAAANTLHCGPHLVDTPCPQSMATPSWVASAVQVG